jgi:hypothetical protein
MILNKGIEITITPNLFQHFDKLGYENLRSGEKKIIPIEHLPVGSGQRVGVKCDVCGCEKEIKYQDYNKNISKYGIYSCSRKCSQQKVEITNLEKYGCKAPAQSEEVLNKMMNTKLDKYGDPTFVNVEKRNETSLKLHGIVGYNNREKCRDTKLKNYGDPYYTNREKAEQTMEKRYGEKFPSHVKEIFQKQQKNAMLAKKYKSTGLYYRGSYEKDFLDYCYSNKIDIQQGPTIRYEFESSELIYYPDFYYEPLNLIVEIKSEYTFKKDLKKNLCKKKGSKDKGYNFIFIIDKYMKEFEMIIKS